MKRKDFFYQFHAVSRAQQEAFPAVRGVRLGVREPSVKIFRSPLSAEFWRHCVLSGRTQRRACPRYILWVYIQEFIKLKI